jgi:hypothetical protein
MALRKGGQLTEDADVQTDDGLDPGTLNLDRYLVICPCPGPVNLGEGAGSHGLIAYPSKYLGKRATEFSLDYRLGFDVRERGYAILKLAHLLDKFGRKQVGPTTQYLPELDKRRSQLLKGKP